MSQPDKPVLREQIYRIIFETDTPNGRRFDIVLLWAILLSTGVVMLESVSYLRESFPFLFTNIEYVFTIVFTLEYTLRIWTARKRLGYALSFFGIIDLLSILPTYITFFVTSSQYLLVIRVFRLFRVFRVLKLARYLSEANTLVKSLRDSRAKILVFLFAVFNVAIIMGTIMYLVEGGEHGFTSIPTSIYWAIVTMTTVGFGDIHPTTALGQFLSMILMVMGYGIIAVPTGIIGVDMIKEEARSTGKNGPQLTDANCSNCGHIGHLEGAHYCSHCGAKL